MEMSLNHTLDELMPGQQAVVTRVGGSGALRRRLMDMGLIHGVRVEMLKAAPLADPVEYKVRGYHLSLRKAEARLVEIEIQHEEAHR